MELYFFKQWVNESNNHGINWNELDISQGLLVSSHPLCYRVSIEKKVRELFLKEALKMSWCLFNFSRKFRGQWLYLVFTLLFLQSSWVLGSK